MFDFDVEIYDGMQLSHGNFADYIKNKMVLICPNVKTMQKPTLKYFQYLEKLLNLQNLDEIIIIDSTGSKFFHPTVRSFFPKITTVSTTSEKYIQALQKQKNKSQELHFLLKNWTFQQLVNNNIEIGFWEQPQDNHWTHLTKNKRAMQELLPKGNTYDWKIVANLFRSKSDFWNVASYNFLFSEKDEIRNKMLTEIGHKLWFFNLYNNKDLEDAINGNNTEKIA